jgi:FMN phosphatase YigB (HAD superfamily)
MAPTFLYFDMGNVLLNFSHEREAEQIARVAGLQPAAVWKLLFEDGLHWQAERGELSGRPYYDRFCELTGVRPDYAAFEQAGNDIFWLNEAIVPLVEGLRTRGLGLGVLSNTSAAHWEHCTRRFALLGSDFAVHALSFQIGIMKPDPRIYAAATRLAGVRPGEILFIDDRPENVAAARMVGWDAVVFSTAESLNADLSSRGLLSGPQTPVSAAEIVR